MGRSPRGGHGNPLQYSCMEKALDRGAWWATVHGVTKELDTTQQVNKKKSLEKQHFWPVQLSAPISGSISGAKQILLTVTETTPILTSLLTRSNMKELALKAASHLGTSLYTRLHRGVLTWVLKRKNVRCQLSPGKWVLLDSWYLEHFRYPELFKRILLPYISHSCHFEQKKPPFQTWSHRKLYPEDKNCSLKWTCILLLRMLELWSPVIELGSFWACQVLEIRHLIFWKKSEMNNVNIQRGASSPKFITEIPFTPVRRRTGQNSWVVWGNL